LPFPSLDSTDFSRIDNFNGKRLLNQERQCECHDYGFAGQVS